VIGDNYMGESIAAYPKPLRLEPGSSYAWRLTIDNQT
jgi:hypothetical protein